MHASLMEDYELATLERQVVEFFETRKGARVAVTEAAAHFEALGPELTRPIEDTLRAYGVVVRPVEDLTRFCYQWEQREDAWQLVGEWLEPSEES